MGGGAIGSAKSQQKVESMQARSNTNVYTRAWETEMMATMCKSPCYCLFAVLCSCCASYHLRYRVLRGDMTQYTCCQGAFPCSGKCGESKCPELCLALETACCFPTSVMVTRFMIQDEMRIQNSKWDNCLIGTLVFCQYLSCICYCAACITGSGELQELAQIVDCMADCVYTSVCACMQTQHKVQLDARDKHPEKFQGGPPVQQFMEMGHIAPGPGPMAPHQGGHPPPSAYPPQGYPPQGYPPHGGAPPPGYPQPGYQQQPGYPPNYPNYQTPQAGYPAPVQAPPPGYPAPPPGYPR